MDQIADRGTCHPGVHRPDGPERDRQVVGLREQMHLLGRVQPRELVAPVRPGPVEPALVGVVAGQPGGLTKELVGRLERRGHLRVGGSPGLQGRTAGKSGVQLGTGRGEVAERVVDP